MIRLLLTGWARVAPTSGWTTLPEVTPVTPRARIRADACTGARPGTRALANPTTRPSRTPVSGPSEEPPRERGLLGEPAQGGPAGRCRGLVLVARELPGVEEQVEVARHVADGLAVGDRLAHRLDRGDAGGARDVRPDALVQHQDGADLPPDGLVADVLDGVAVVHERELRADRRQAQGLARRVGVQRGRLARA